MYVRTWGFVCVWPKNIRGGHVTTIFSRGEISPQKWNGHCYEEYVCGRAPQHFEALGCPTSLWKFRTPCNYDLVETCLLFCSLSLSISLSSRSISIHVFFFSLGLPSLSCLVSVLFNYTYININLSIYLSVYLYHLFVLSKFDSELAFSPLLVHISSLIFFILLLNVVSSLPTSFAIPLLQRYKGAERGTET